MRFESRTALTYFGLLPAQEAQNLAHIRAELAAIRLHLKARREEKYSPDQPRDEQGRWTDAGGDGGGDNVFSGLLAGDVIPICLLGSRGTTTDLFGNIFWYGQYDCPDGRTIERRGMGRIRGFILQPK